MRKTFSVLLAIVAMCVIGSFTGRADSAMEFSVQASATVQESPARITISWPQDTYAVPTSYTIYRRPSGTGSWTQLATLAGSTTSYSDTTAVVGTAYEYQIVKRGANYYGYGYLCSGIKVPMIENRGRLLLVVDKTHASSLATELARLQQDIVGDGWTVTRIDVNRTDTPATVKNLIKAQYQTDPANVKAVFLFGRVPVPYSGDIVPDGHAPDHQGAWPADGYYGDMDGTWTDTSVNTTIATETRNRNVPGDGKFDQSNFPAPLKLMVGRVDLANMPGRLTWGGPATFPSEAELLRNYLNKDHNFRQKKFSLPRRGIVGDYFGSRDGEAFAASGWRNLAAFFGAANVTTLPSTGTWVPTLKDNQYLFAYGCGSGSYTSIGGLGNTGVYKDGITTELYQSDIKAVFTMLFGSWLGDWDSEDNIQRAVLALPSFGLTCSWSGRPHWFMHHMAMGETIGYTTRLTQNNGPGGTYLNQLNSCANWIHIALMGDPTLRLHPVAPPANVKNSGGTLTWTASTDAVVGYHVYRATDPNGPFTRVSTSLVNGTSFTDSTGGSGTYTYMVRAVALEQSGSGTYYNPSQGAFTTGSASSTSSGGTTSSGTSNTTDTTTATNTTSSSGTSTNSAALLSAANETVWFDDALPSGAVAGGDNDSWNWVSSNPTPFSGTRAHQSSLAAGMHQHYFDWAYGQLLNVNPGDTLFAYVYIDPANPPSQIFLHWNDGTWEHGAYWGADKLNWGVAGTASRRYMGPMPASGIWVRLEVPASQLGLEGSIVKGMAFTAFDGRVTWDKTGKSTAPTNGGGDGSTGGGSTITNTPNSSITNDVWFDDALPAGAVGGGDNGETWNWVSANPAPFSGTVAHKSIVAPGMHQHHFDWAYGKLLYVNPGDALFAYVYIDPANVPAELMLHWNDGTWEHRAYWGSNTLPYGTDGTASRRYVGPMPPAGQWVRLEVPASQVGLEGAIVKGMAFTVYNGGVTWDFVGKANGLMYPPGGSTNDPGNGNGGGGSTTNTPPNTTTNTIISIVTNVVDTVWVDDNIPAGATAHVMLDAWNWVSENPSPQRGSRSHKSNNSGGFHQHSFMNATERLAVSSGDSLYTYVYIDPQHVPNEIMLQWHDGDSQEHRAYWGANRIPWGIDGSNSRRYMGPIPAVGKWVRLEVPADLVGLENKSLRGMAFSLHGGRVAWDNSGKSVTTIVTNYSNVATNIPPTNAPPVVTNNLAVSSNWFGSTAADNIGLNLPKPLTNALRVLAPNYLELKLINTKSPAPARVAQWDFVDSNYQFVAPPPSAFSVTVNGQPVAVQAVGFKRRPLYAPLMFNDLRIENSLYLQLGSAVSDNQVVEVTNPNGAYWPASMKFIAKMDPHRFSPAVHVNHEGYMPNRTKKAMVGFYLGSLGELNIFNSSGFKLIDANTGSTVFTGTLTARPDVGWQYSPTPYQKVYEADFSTFNTPGNYRLVVPGLGASLPFPITEGVAMNFARAFALGIYNQRCGTSNSLPFTRFTHDKCHHAQVTVPVSASTDVFTWTTIANYANVSNPDNPVSTAPKLTSPQAQLFPYVRTGTIDVSGGHHDAGDYSKYTLNSVALIHYLMFAVDSMQGVAALDNLGLPESGDGVSDLMQSAKWEADFLAKMQDSDGGFYFLVYPRNRAYESDVQPDKGDPQVVWPKTSSATAASVAALAECASSPAFKAAYPQEAAAYLDKAKLGWQFLMNAISRYGKNGIYQKITHYGDDFADQDELAWAAAAMFAATGDPQYQQALFQWFPDPTNPAMFRWGWWKMYLYYGNAVRAYAFAVKSGRLQPGQVNADYLAKCNATIVSAGDDLVKWSQQSAYGTSFPEATKHVKGAGWYFSGDQTFDLAVAYQVNAKQAFIDAIIANMNFEGGGNPVNVSFVTGLGWKRERDAVSQYAATDRRLMPPSGQPIGNIQNGFSSLWFYGSELPTLCYPSDNATSAPFPFYERWGDSWNVTTEFVTFIQARSLASYAFLAALTSLKSQAWKPMPATINIPAGIAAVGAPLTVSVSAPGLDLTGARVVWEVANEDPMMSVGPTLTFVPKNIGTQWIEVEAQLPDGRRVVAHSTFSANSPNFIWVDDALPVGAVAGVDNGDFWKWVTSPAPVSGSLVQESAVAPGQHQHFFDNATATMTVQSGSVLYCWVYLDPANPPAEVMLSWNAGSWSHNAYWGANNINFGTDGTDSRRYMGPLPELGKWVQLKVPASQVGLEGKIVKGMAFDLFNGRAWWDAAGVLNP